MYVVLCQPQIPQNTGNIVRSCAVTGSNLILVRPLGFSLADRWLKRAGLDYWEGVNVEVIDELELLSLMEEKRGSCYCFSSKATRCYSQVSYQREGLLIFGSETMGIPEVLWERWPESFVTLPMRSGARCLNLATTVGIGLYEAWRQQDFETIPPLDSNF